VSPGLRQCSSRREEYANGMAAQRSKVSRWAGPDDRVPQTADTAQRPAAGGARIAVPRVHLEERMVPMATMVSQYEVVELTPNGRPWREHVQQLLNDYADDGWELITSFQAEGGTPRPVDQMIRSLSHVPSSTLFIFKRPT
jgi:hypothetical protein